MTFRHFLTTFILILSPAVLFCSSIHDETLDATIYQANDLFLNADFDGGLELIASLEKTHSDHPAVSYFLANGYWWKIFRAYIYDKEARIPEFEEKFDSYLEQTIVRSENLLKINKRDVTALFWLGNAYSLKSRVKGLHGSYFGAARDAGKGKGYLEEVLKIQPNQYDAYYNLGVYNYLAGTLPGYAKVLKVFLFLPGGTKEKGLSLLKIAGKKSAYFGPEAQLILARFYADFEDQPAEALQIVETFHTKYPDNAWFHYWLGTLYSDDLNDYDKAETIFTQVLQRCNQNVPGYTAELKNQAWLKSARVMSRQLYPFKAIDELKALLATKPTQPSWIVPRILLELGAVYDQIGMRKDAITVYTQVLSFKDYRNSHEQANKLRSQSYNQTIADIYRLNLEGRRLTAEGKFDQAGTSLQKVLEKYPNNEQTLYAMAELGYSKGEYSKSADILRALLKRNPKEPKWLVPGIYVRLGQVYQASSQAAAAKQSYEKALETKFLASDDRNLAKRALKQMKSS